VVLQIFIIAARLLLYLLVASFLPQQSLHSDCYAYLSLPPHFLDPPLLVLATHASLDCLGMTALASASPRQG
jgi:hypothetical protein